MCILDHSSLRYFPDLKSWLKEVLYTLVFSLTVVGKNFLKRQTLTLIQRYSLPQVGKVPGSLSRVLHWAKITRSSSVSSLEGAFCHSSALQNPHQKKQLKRRKDFLRDYPSQSSDSQRVASLPLSKHFTPQGLFQGVH